jgi:ferredoxin
MLITDRGCCGRFGSLVTDLPPPPEGLKTGMVPVGTAGERCLYKRKGGCGLCRKKCPAGAYAVDGTFNRKACYGQCLKNAEIFRDIGLADVCGKCLVGLPCSDKAPA